MARRPRLERDVEADFVDGVEALGLIAVKLVILGWAGWPDRLVLGPNQFIVFVELKRPGEGPRPSQGYVHKILRRFGFHVIVSDSAPVAIQAIKTAMGS